MTMYRNSLGMMNRVVAGLIVLVVVVAGVVAWKVSSDNKKTPATSVAKVASNAAVEATCLKTVGDSKLCKFASHYNPNAPYKASDTATGTGGTQTLTISSDGNGNSQITTVANGQTADFISLDGATYVKDESSGSWIKYSAPTNTPASTNPASGLKISSSDITGNGTTSYKNLGTEACGNLTCFKYQIIDTSTPDTTQYIWFDNQNYQLHQFYSKNTTSTSDMTFTYQNVKIAAPSPVKDVSAGSANPYTAQ